jgi:hypothetical protein
MFPSKDGKKFGSAYVAKRRDAEHDKAAQVMEGTNALEKPASNPDEKALMGEKPAVENEPEQKAPEAPAQVVMAHGKANTIHVAHDHKNGKHHVISTHEDGHVHESEFKSPKEAHDAALALSGGDQPPAEAPGTEEPAADGFKMPRLA